MRTAVTLAALVYIGRGIKSEINKFDILTFLLLVTVALIQDLMLLRRTR